MSQNVKDIIFKMSVIYFLFLLIGGRFLFLFRIVLILMITTQDFILLTRTIKHVHDILNVICAKHLCQFRSTTNT